MACSEWGKSRTEFELEFCTQFALPVNACEPSKALIPWSNGPLRDFSVCPSGTSRWSGGNGLEHCKWLHCSFVSFDAQLMSTLPEMRGN